MWIFTTTCRRSMDYFEIILQLLHVPVKTRPHPPLTMSATLKAAGVHTILPKAPHMHTMILLHGRGSDAPTFCDELFESQDRR